MAALVGGAIVILLALVVGMAFGDVFAGRNAATWAAIAAILAGLAAIAQAAFAAIALASLRYNRMAAEASARAAEASNRAAEAANSTLMHQQETTERQLRAYFGYDEAVARNFKVGENADFKATFINAGATPVMSGTMKAVFFLAPAGSPNFAEALGGVPEVEIGPTLPGREFWVTDRLLQVTSAVAHAVTFGEAAVYFAYEVTYADAYATDRKSSGQYIWTMDDQAFSVLPGGAPPT